MEGHENKTLKQKDLWHDSEQNGSSKYWKTARRQEGAGKKPKRKDCGRKFGVFSSTEQCGTETTIQDEIKQSLMLCNIVTFVFAWPYSFAFFSIFY
jgi:hypothetical protein